MICRHWQQHLCIRQLGLFELASTILPTRTWRFVARIHVQVMNGNIHHRLPKSSISRENDPGQSTQTFLPTHRPYIPLTLHGNIYYKNPTNSRQSMAMLTAFLGLSSVRWSGIGLAESGVKKPWEP